MQKPSELPGTMPLVQNVTTMDSLSPVVRVPLNPAEIYRHWNTRGSRGVGRGRGRGRGRGAVDEATRQALRPYVDSGDRGDRREAGSDGWRTYVVPGVIWLVSRPVVALTVRVRVGCAAGFVAMLSRAALHVGVAAAAAGLVTLAPRSVGADATPLSVAPAATATVTLSPPSPTTVTTRRSAIWWGRPTLYVCLRAACCHRAL